MEEIQKIQLSLLAKLDTRLYCGHGFWFIVMEQFRLFIALAWLGLLRHALMWALSYTGWKLPYESVMIPHAHQKRTNGLCQHLPRVSHTCSSGKQISVVLNVKKQSATAPSASVLTVTPPSQTEKEDFFCEIAKEQGKKPLILSIIKPYNDKFVQSSDRLPKLLHGIFKPEYLDKNYTELLTLAENYLQEKVTPAMVDHLNHITRDQSKSKHWFDYRAGRITASRVKQVISTDPHQPSLSLLNSLCYPDIHKFST